MVERYCEGWEDVNANVRGHRNTYVTSGTFTPVIAFGGASVGITYASRFGYYTQIGPLMHVDFDIVLTSKGSSTGAATISGLPAMSRIGPTHQMFILGADYLTFPASEIPKPHLPSGSTTLQLKATKSNQATTVLDNTDFADNTTIEISGSYLTEDTRT